MFSSRRHALRFGLGSALFLGSFLEARGGRLPAYEERIFRGVNGASDRLRIPVRAIMQAGTFATVPAVSAVALLAGRRRLAASLLASGTAAWLGAKAAKPLAGRARPEARARRCAGSRRDHGRPGLGLGSHGGRDHPRLRRLRSGAALGSACCCSPSPRSPDPGGCTWAPTSPTMWSAVRGSA